MAALASSAAAAAPLLNSVFSLTQLQSQIHLPHSPLSLFSPTTKLNSHSSIFRSPWPPRRNVKGLVPFSHTAVSVPPQGSFDPDLHSVLELATDSELYELERILFGKSYFSPLLKSITTKAEVDYFMIEEDPDERDDCIAILESRFFFLAADARSTLRGWRPSYRNVLLGVREKLNIPCSRKLSTEDLEAEIFFIYCRNIQDTLMTRNINALRSEESGTLPSSWESSKISNSHGSLEVGLSQWKAQASSASRVGAAELRTIFLKGGGILALENLYNLLVRKLLGRMFVEAANYQIRNDIIRKGGQFAAINLESKVALLTAKQGVAGAAARYLGLRSMMAFLGPMLWGIFLADVVIQMLGTDYARILRAIYAFAQIRITRTYKVPSDIS